MNSVLLSAHLPLSFIFFSEICPRKFNFCYLNFHVSVEVRDCLGTVRTFESRRGVGARDGALASDSAQTTRSKVWRNQHFMLIQQFTLIMVSKFFFNHSPVTLCGSEVLWCDEKFELSERLGHIKTRLKDSQLLFLSVERDTNKLKQVVSV